jgi:Trk K+ transport system NAD-binding subunit
MDIPFLRAIVIIFPLSVPTLFLCHRLRAPTSFSDLRLARADVDIRTFRIEEGSPLVGKSLAEMALRRDYGVTVLAIRRDTRVLSTYRTSGPGYPGCPGSTREACRTDGFARA